MPLVESDGSKEAILQTVIRVTVVLVVKMESVEREATRCCCGQRDPYR
jgi:hypothetical protein